MRRWAKIHFWLTFIGVYCVFFPMHILGIGGQMRRIYDPTQYTFLVPQQPVNVFITYAAFVLGAAQVHLPGQLLRQHLCRQTSAGEQSMACHNSRMDRTVSDGTW